MSDIKRQLQKIIKGEVYDNPETLEKYSHDASLFKVMPKLIVFPKDSYDIKNLVTFVNKNNVIANDNLSITARSAGTDMTGGPLNESIIIDFTKYFNQIKKIGLDSAIAQPGVYYRDFEKQTLKRDLLLPSYPASKSICALGGMVANNSGGEKTLAYGKTEKYVQELKVVLSDGNEYLFKPLTFSQLKQKIKKNGFEGEVYKKIYQLISKNRKIIKNARPNVSKNSSGYALWDVWPGKIFDIGRLFIGSQGTLGLVTEIKFKLIRPKKHSKLLVIFLKDLSLLTQITHKILQYNPESFEFFDNYTLKLGMRYLMWKHFWRFIPESLMFIKGGFPKIVMIAEFTGDSQNEAEEKALEAKTVIKEFNLPSRITSSKQDTEKYWTIRRESFNLLRHKIKNKKTTPFIDDIIVSPDHLQEFIPKLEKILKIYDLEYTMVGHIGDGNLHIIPLMNLADKNSEKIIANLAKKVYKLVFEFNGSMSAEHNDGIIRTPFVKQMYGPEVYKLFQEVKKIFDPNNIFNPGKKVGGTFSYAIKHIYKQQ